ncbi:putative N-ethylmaleimide-sensitive factor attachment protein, beta [Monocercomonoides exilis]|uniref:putative N-ethylmaleimide-sensitive factor attachment protein, beta n=1 Tax=Monocercomonoides exilis TaxID=2049356 RepID=UPI00355982B9|nr:putative N-ethylmaleimide-sensitive factor attachment protein, beta [Monocercomonoides exilis]|eukprot:MONOS_15522.1-p1 / transcript=MONOS_15522.1 / gene=MONOS_15522 / organism=Monocercomonoides_exilis_PA203 / gene_product=N-ethylmaleimide-sensitive factor attachment protein, beta / transcript_product=N-ethylmaleimide-sensitive factor attachment protein, beta / location=Mono_scaffold01260:8682-9844(-) / protein_length=287 / sequence_SO=supercontig / SO=protein_coding / is_pseudo=false
MISISPQELERNADKKMNSWFFRQTSFDEAGDMFFKAANKYKIQRMFVESGKAFEKAADSYKKCGRIFDDVAQQYLEAAKAYKTVNHEDYVRCQEKAIDIEKQGGSMNRAAGHLMELAKVREGAGDFDGAIKNYTESCELYQIDDKNRSARRCQEQLAIIYSLHKKNYLKASELFETLGRSKLEESISRFNAKECWFKACICHLMTKDRNSVRDKLRSYEEMDPSLSDSYEKKLIESLCEAVDEADEVKSSAAVSNYDSVHRPDPWKTQMLLRLKDDIHKDDENSDL